MALIVIYDPGHANERVLQVIPSANTPDYDTRPDVVVNPDLGSLIEPQKYWRHDTGAIRDMNAGEKAALDAEEVAALTAANRTYATGEIQATTGKGVRTRALADMMIREINILRGWTVDLKTETAAATSLADFQARVATLASLADRTLAQAKTAYLNLINAGEVDDG